VEHVRLNSRRLTVVAAVVGFAMLLGGGASAAPGDQVADLLIADSAGGVSVAFDGLKLYYTSFSGTTLHSINTDGTTGHVDVPITDSVTGGAVPIDAFSFDGTRGVFWGASGTAIYQITTAGSATFQFDVAADLVGDCDNGAFGCSSLVDGLGYDASDDSIWYSPDASQRIYHFLVPGGAPAPTPFIDVNDPPNDMLAECGFNYSSGVAAGLSVLYLGADGCTKYFQYDKLGTKLASFPYIGERAEDFECDNVTFGVDVMWVRDAFDGHIRAFEVPVDTCAFGGGGGIGFMTGGGSVFTSGGVRVTHGFQLNCDSSKTPNNLQINWGKGNKFHLTSLTSALCSDDPAISPEPPGADFDTYVGEGTGKYNGVPGATAEWTFTDAGEPGTSDTATIVVKDASNAIVLSVSGTLTNGNHQAHSG
jgi:hypothetical protein